MGTIVIPALIVAVVGLIFGIILTIASKLMYVPVDEKIAALDGDDILRRGFVVVAFAAGRQKHLHIRRAARKGTGKIKGGKVGSDNGKRRFFCG